MSVTTIFTDTVCAVGIIYGGKQIEEWVEFQLLDEQGEPLAHQPYRAINEATRCHHIPEFRGKSDAQGIIRLENVFGLALTLLLTANPLAEVLQTRRLRATRAETPVSFPYRYDPSPAGHSPIEQQALADGHAYHYLRIGQVCDRLPDLEPALSAQGKLPAFHFPDPEFKGFTVSGDVLNRRHVLEICPLRAWSLVLHHQPEYSMVNAYNLGLMASLSYSTAHRRELEWQADADLSNVLRTVEDFFFRQCSDLSRTPMVTDVRGDTFPAVVVDVPFDHRYTTAVMLDSLTAERPPAGSEIPRGIIENTQLFYAIGPTQVIVGWRGTQEPKDWVTDVMYRPMPADGSGCDLKTACTPLTDSGSVHYGFLHAFEVAKAVFPRRFNEIKRALLNRELYVCGHSLGGALALIHSAELKDHNPLLYTYGMPRTFTAKALESIKTVTHFRHVNDADMITSVPPEAELDNWLYNAFGPLGYLWSALALPGVKLTGYGDPYHHHGQIAMFYRATQHVESRGSTYMAYRNKDGLDAPYHNKVLLRLTHRTRMYLVPSLNDEFSRFALEEHKALIRSLSQETLAQAFPSHTNPERSTSRSSPSDHSMIGAYLPFLNNQLLELSDPERPMRRKVDRAKFEEQMRTPDIPEAEAHRNQQFLALQKLLPMAMRPTLELEGGPDALQRFCEKQDSVLPIEITHA